MVLHFAMDDQKVIHDLVEEMAFPSFPYTAGLGELGKDLKTGFSVMVLCLC